jgi:hypothetical protein
MAAQSFSGNVLARGLAGRKVQDLLQHPQHTGALFALVADKRVAVSGSGDASAGGGSGSGSAALLWLDRAGLASALDISYAGGEQMSLGQQGDHQISAPVYFLGEDVQQQMLRLAVDVTAAPAAWTEERQLRLQVRRLLCGLESHGTAQMLDKHLCCASVLTIGALSSTCCCCCLPQDLRSLMPLLPPGELAIAGHAMALSQWHQVGG